MFLREALRKNSELLHFHLNSKDLIPILVSECILSHSEREELVCELQLRGGIAQAEKLVKFILKKDDEYVTQFYGVLRSQAKANALVGKIEATLMEISKQYEAYPRKKKRKLQDTKPHLDHLEQIDVHMPQLLEDVKKEINGYLQSLDKNTENIIGKLSQKVSSVFPLKLMTQSPEYCILWKIEAELMIHCWSGTAKDIHSYESDLQLLYNCAQDKYYLQSEHHVKIWIARMLWFNFYRQGRFQKAYRWLQAQFYHMTFVEPGFFTAFIWMIQSWTVLIPLCEERNHDNSSSVKAFSKALTYNEMAEKHLLSDSRCSEHCYDSLDVKVQRMFLELGCYHPPMLMCEYRLQGKTQMNKMKLCSVYNIDEQEFIEKTENFIEQLKNVKSSYESENSSDVNFVKRTIILLEILKMVNGKLGYTNLNSYIVEYKASFKINNSDHLFFRDTDTELPPVMSLILDDLQKFVSGSPSLSQRTTSPSPRLLLHV